MEGSENQSEANAPCRVRSGFSLEQISTLRRNPPHVMNEREVAIYLDLSERNVRTLRKSRSLPHVRLGGRILYRLAEINRALEKLEIRSV
jgi:hypothetical protein